MDWKLLFKCVYVCIFVCIFVNVCAYVCVFGCKLVSVRVYVCVHICVPVRVCVCVCTCAHTHTLFEPMLNPQVWMQLFYVCQYALKFMLYSCFKIQLRRMSVCALPCFTRQQLFKVCQCVGLLVRIWVHGYMYVYVSVFYTYMNMCMYRCLHPSVTRRHTW